MDQSNQKALDYYLLPRIGMTVPRLRLAECPVNIGPLDGLLYAPGDGRRVGTV